MKNVTSKYARRVLTGTIIGASLLATLQAQYGTGLPPIYQNQPTNNSTYRPYSSYYQDQLRNYRQTGVSPQQYTMDRYFYHRPTISPYLNLTRRSGPYVNNYYAYVKPEQERRAQAARTPGTSTSDGSPRTGKLNPYYGHWYQPRP